MKQWSINNKVFLLTLLPTVSVAIFFASAYVITRVTDLKSDLNRHGIESAIHLANAVQHGILAGNTNQLIGLCIATLEGDEIITSVTVYGRNNQILAHAGPKIRDLYAIPGTLVSTPATYNTEELLRFSAPVKLKDLSLVTESNKLSMPQGSGLTLGSIIGWTVIEVSRDSMMSKTYAAYLTALTGVILTGLVGILLAFSLSRSLAQPLQQFSQALSDIKEGKLDTRVLVESSPEIMKLQGGINDMAESLANARSEMQENIDQATQDLRETLETIEIQNIELDIARKEALEASRVKSEFLANMSHEIRTPLNGIIGFTKLLAKSNLGIQQRDQLNTILKSSEILLTIINDILDFSKIEAGKLVLDHTALNIREIIEDVLTMLAPGAHEKNLDVTGMVYSDVPEHVIGDPLRIKQIITNLVSNGIKFTQSGEVVVRVMVEDEDGDIAQIKITVTDTGVGLSRVQQQALFTPFSQADASTARRYGGTGLGLVISRRLTEQMGGNIGVDSELGKGSEFWIQLPVRLAKGDDIGSSEDSPDIAGERIIYLEYQPKTRLAVSHVLNKWNLVVTPVDNLPDLIKQVAEAQKIGIGYAAAMIGVTRHHLRSASVLDTVRQLEYQLDCRTLLLTPTIEAGEEEPAILAEASGYLVKPTSQRRLANTLRQLIRGTEPGTPGAAQKSQQVIQVSRKPRVLAVDDNIANLKLIEALLDDLGAIPETARSGYEALTKAKLRRYDIIFMDVQMPGMDGISTTGRIREFEANKYHTPIIALTAHALAEEKSKLLTSGFDSYLTKPTNEEELQQTIAKHAGFNLSPRPEMQDVYAQRGGPIKPSVKHAMAPSVDIAGSVQLAGKKTDLAEELFSMLLESLINERDDLLTAKQGGDDEKLLETVHRLHGATRYCGVPAMRTAAAQLETHLKRRLPDAQPKLESLLDEIDRVLYWAERNDWQSAFRQFIPE